MAKVTIQPGDKSLAKYYSTIKELRDAQTKPTEGNMRRAFGTLLTDLGRRRRLTLVDEYGVRAKQTGNYIRPDGALLTELKFPFAFWEAKDGSDNLDNEIGKKLDRGYPDSNIIFEDTYNAVLIQDGKESARTPIREKASFARLLSAYFNYRKDAFDSFDEAIRNYGEQIREIASALNDKVKAAHSDNREFQDKFERFMDLCRVSLNPNISVDAVDEMLIQHLMTEPIIRRVFKVPHFSQENVIAARIQELVAVLMRQFFMPSEFYGPLDKFHRAIELAADPLDFADKQAFINTVYERFFQGYSVKVADTHGIVYTPHEIVSFMVRAVDDALQSHFDKRLGDPGIVVIDPATGTGNFIVQLLRHVHERNISQLRDFYRERLFANEVMLMPYYIASLNIEHCYYEMTGGREEFRGLCFVDTLDLARERQMTFLTEANTERVNRQRDAAINVIIGNPPYNVGQINENDNNKNRKYDVIDQRIRETYARDSNATLKNQLYDAYVRFWRWAVDRLGGRPGIVCYITNNSFVDAYAFDGFRKHMLQDFDEVYHLDLGGNLRKTRPGQKISNVFDIRVGVGVTVAIRKEQ